MAGSGRWEMFEVAVEVGIIKIQCAHARSSHRRATIYTKVQEDYLCVSRETSDLLSTTKVFSSPSRFPRHPPAFFFFLQAAWCGFFYTLSHV